MKRLAWIGIYLVSIGWFVSLDVYTRSSHWWLWPIIIGSLILYPALRHEKPKGSLILLLGILNVFLFHWPYSVSGVLLFAAGVLYLFRRHSVPKALGNCFFVSGFALFLAALLTGIYYLKSPHFQGQSFFSPIFYAVIKLFAHGAALTNGTIVLPAVDGIRELNVSVEKLGLFPILLFYASAVSFLYFIRAKGRTYSYLTLITLGFIFVRFVALSLAFLQGGKSSIFWMRAPLILSTLPLPLFLSIFPSVLTSEPVAKGSGGRKNGVLPASIFLLLAFLSGMFLAGFAGFGDPGVQKQGRILIDEGHSDWEWTTQKFDTEWYGGKSGYNYYCLRDYLNHFYKVDAGMDSITESLLSNYDILFIKTPTRPFSNREIDAIEKFVRAGGGLFLDGDHTNVFGSSTFANPLAERFGLRFNYDATYDLRSLSLSVYNRPSLLPHPVVQRVPTYLFATSCSMDAPMFSDKVIIGYGLRAVRLDYSRTSYFADASKEQNYDFGLFIQAAGTKIGKGRVLGYTDSTVWSNFFMFIPGKPELILGTMEWLNRENRFGFLNPLLLVLGLASLGFGLLVLRKKRIENWAAILAVAGLIGFGLGARIFASGNLASYKDPAPHTGFTKVAFDWEHSRFTLPVYSLEWDQRLSFHTFYTWTQRLGLVPSLEKSFSDALRKGDIVVVINPIKRFAIEEVDEMTEFVRKGGRLLLLDSPRNWASTGNELIGPFLMKTDTLTVASSACFDSTRREIATLSNAGMVEGGKPLFTLSNGNPVASYSTFGEGKIVVFNASSNFATETLGGSSALPTPAQRKLYDLEFSLLRFLLKK
ncbi:MAG: hypothetical protein QME66_03125 [Candidatus Eisenbacteria bacterium]|nr:hypothetical protein [Candidatus Eisenbacteria bacterium]